MPTSRIAAVLIAAALACALLPACSGTGRGQSRRASEPGATATALPVLRVMVPQGAREHDARLQEIVRSLDELNASVEITVTLSASYEPELADALASLTPPDVFLATGSMLPELAAAGTVAPVPDGWIDRGRLLQAAATGIEVDGETYCFPHSVGTLALVYNADLFAAAGVPPPSAAWSWDDLARAASAITNADEGITGMVLDPSPMMWMPFYLQAGGTLIEEAGAVTLAQAPARQASAYFASLFAGGSAATPAMLDAAWSGEAFAAGNVGMTIAGDWIVDYLASTPAGFTAQVVELPRGPAQRDNIAWSSCLAVHAAGSNRDLALQLAAQLTAPEVLPTWTGAGEQGIPVYAEQEVVAEGGRSDFDPYLRTLRYATPWRLAHFAQDHAGLFATGIQMVVDEEITAGEFWPYLNRGGIAASPG